MAPDQATTGTGPVVGAVGLGNMGGPIARCIYRAGLDAVVLDTRADVLREFADQGIETATTIAGLARCDLVAVTVLDDDQVKEVVGALATTLAPGSNVIVHSTVLPETILAAAKLLEGHDIGVIDAPVSGAAWAAEKGELAVMVGGEDAVIEACRPELDAIGVVRRVGYLGDGEAVKILNNLMNAGAWVVTCEAMRIARRLGVSEATVREVTLTGSGQSWPLEHIEQIDETMRTHVAASQAGGIANLVSKDPWLAARLARGAGLHLPFVAGLVEAVPGAVETRIAELGEAGAESA
jgi:3-hydroxyisobutyrate dehydrogenase